MAHEDYQQTEVVLTARLTLADSLFQLAAIAVE